MTHDRNRLGRPERSRRHPGPGEFAALNLPETVLDGIQDAGFSEMTPVQKKALPIALAGRDLCAQAQTGTGKTATFLITLFSRLTADREEGDAPAALILAPTRELALQIYREASLLGKHTDLRIAAIYGGEGYSHQEKKLRSGVDVVVGTPGRLLDFAQKKALDLSRIRFLVIDEADRLLDMGFWEELARILRRLPPPSSRQSMLFSATLDARTKSIASGYMNHPQDVAIAPERVAAEGIDQVIYHVDRDRKFPLLLGILAREEVSRGLIFANMKVTAAFIAEKLRRNGYPEVELLTGDLPQAARNRVLQRFSEGKVRLLVASDVAARGLHIEDVSHIINFDVPQDPGDYVHRIGRTARAGKRGRAITLACDQYCWTLPEIEQLVAVPIESRVPHEEEYGEDAAPDLTRRSMKGRGGGGRGGRPGGRAREGRAGGRRDRQRR